MTAPVDRLSAIVGAAHVSTDPDVLAGRSVDWTGRYRGTARALVRPGSAEEVAAVLKACRDDGIAVTVQGGRTSLVAGTVPEHDDVLLSTERLTRIGDVDTVERQVRVEAGVTLADLQRAAAGAGLLFGVDLAARDSATVGGMASTNAGGLRTVRYGTMGAQWWGSTSPCPTDRWCTATACPPRQHRLRPGRTSSSAPRAPSASNTAVDLRLHPQPAHRVTAVCGFADLAALVGTGRVLRDLECIAALELVDGRAAGLAAEHLDTPAPVSGDWLLLAGELAGRSDPTERLAAVLDTRAASPGPAAVGTDPVGCQRLWQLREVIARGGGAFGPPVKFDIVASPFQRSPRSRRIPRR